VATEPPKFILDSDLFPLCKALRMLGFDALSRANLPPPKALECAIEERRVWIRFSSDDLNLQYGIRYFVVEHKEIAEQLRELDAQLNLKETADPLSLCLKCNCRIVEISKESIQQRVPPRVYATFDHCYTCPQCHRIYWPGSHYQRMTAKLAAWGWKTEHGS
jgi:uncharacterized protein with PIN domain